MAKKLAKKAMGGDDTLKKKQPGFWGISATKVAELNAAKARTTVNLKKGDTTKVGTVTVTRKKSGGQTNSKKK